MIFVAEKGTIMSDLEDIRLSVERFVTAVSDSMRLEVAVFDSDCQLFYCTPTYVKKKGRTVHAPSLREVEPGHMAACHLIEKINR